MAPAMPCKTCKKSKNVETRSKTNDFKSKFACILEASESTRLRMERMYVVRGEINEKTAYIQARSSMARALEVNGKARQAEGEAKVV